MKPFYTSRSAIETKAKCPRKRWLNYHYGGKGITQAQASVPLTTGTCVHEGVGFLMRNASNGLISNADQHYLTEESNWLDSAVSVALQSYKKIVEESGVQTNGQNTQFVLEQEMARTEALVRAWSIAEFPLIVKDYNIYSVEDEIVMPLSRDILMQVRVDAILQGKDDGKMFNYSLKTMKGYREKDTDRQFATALQTQTEVLGAQHLLREQYKLYKNFLGTASQRLQNEKRYQTLTQFVSKYMPAPQQGIYGTKHCFLIKGGKAKEGEYGEYTAGDSPLIRGYRADTGSSIIYVHSFRTPNSGNKSGYSVIGKAFQAFNVWEQMTIKEWIALLNSKVQDHTGEIVPEIQPECGDIIKAQVITPPETFAKKEELESTLVQITHGEELVRMLVSDIGPEETYGGNLDKSFEMNRASCYNMGVCEFTPICLLKDWKGDAVSREVRNDPVGSGMFKWRVPHHRAELEAMNNG
jgi:hypothetical protein